VLRRVLLGPARSTLSEIAGNVVDTNNNTTVSETRNVTTSMPHGIESLAPCAGNGVGSWDEQLDLGVRTAELDPPRRDR